MTKSLIKKKLCVDCGNAITTNSHGMCDDCLLQMVNVDVPMPECLPLDPPYKPYKPSMEIVVASIELEELDKKVYARFNEMLDDPEIGITKPFPEIYIEEVYQIRSIDGTYTDNHSCKKYHFGMSLYAMFSKYLNDLHEFTFEESENTITVTTELVGDQLCEMKKEVTIYFECY